MATLGSLLLLVDTVLILLFSKDGNRQAHAAGGAIPTAPLSLSTRILNILRLRLFWNSMAFFAGVFGSFLTFAESWNIQFQIEVFHLNHLVAPLVNSAVILGVAVGSIASGAIADRWGYPRPAQVGAVLRFMNLMLLASTVLAEWIAVICQSVLGIWMGTFVLGLVCLRASVRENGTPSNGFLTAAIGWSAVDPRSAQHVSSAINMLWAG